MSKYARIKGNHGVDVDMRSDDFTYSVLGRAGRPEIVVITQREFPQDHGKLERDILRRLNAGKK